MKMAVAIAGFAVVCGSPAAWMPETVKVIAGFAFGAFVVVFAVKVLNLLKKMKQQMEFIAEKCSYMEQRMDAAAAKTSDVCRHVQRIFEEFDEDSNEGVSVESKWWWVQRRMRAVCEDFCSSRTMESMNFISVKATWSLLQLEVKLRVCRDLIACRFYADPADNFSEEQAGLEHCLKNMMKANEYCEYWRPMSLQHFDTYEATTGHEEILLSQVKERIAELKLYMEQSKSEGLFEDMQLGGIISGSTGSN